MAVTITQGELAVAIRAATDEAAVPAPVATVISFLAPAAAAMIIEYAPNAPDDVHNLAMIRLCGWLFEADPTDSRISRAMEVSGAQGILSRWRSHTLGIVVESGSAGTSPASGLPPLPADGNFILASDDGRLVWVAFPKPAE